MTVRDRFAQLLQESGVSQSEVGRRIGESPSWVNDRLKGRTQINADDLPRIAAALGVRPVDFFEGGPAAAEPAVERAAEIGAERAIAKAEERIRADLRRELREELRAALEGGFEEQRAMWEMFMGRLEARAEAEAEQGEEKAG